MRERKKPRQRQRQGQQLDSDPVGHVLGPAPLRGQIDPETQKYFSEVTALLQTISDDKERATLCASALEEARGKELRVASHPACGRALEELLHSADAGRSLSFLAQCTPDLAAMAMDPSASHVAETMMGCVAEILQQTGGDDTLVSSVESTLIGMSKVLQGSAVEIITNKYGSHVLRKFILLLAGLAETEERGGLTRKLGRRDPAKTSERIIYPGFTELLDKFCNEVLQASGSLMHETVKDQFASLVFQTMIKSLHRTGSDPSGVVEKLLRFQPSDKIPVQAVEQILELMEDQNASHLMEVILEVASDELYSKLLLEVFKGNMKRLATHQFSNFAVQSLVAFARHKDQVTLLLDELGQDFSELIEKRRTGVIVSMLGACSRLGIGQQEICRSIAAVVCPQSASRDDLVPRLLRLEGHDSYRRNAGMSVLGCAMLQTIFTFSQDCSQQFNRSFSKLEPAQVLETVQDRAGCHVVEAFLKSCASPKQKHAVIERLRSHFAELAKDAKAHYVVTKCYDVADIKLKEAIVKELVGIQNELSKSKHGPYILGKLNVARYERASDKWRQSEKTNQSRKDDYANLFQRQQADEEVPFTPSKKKQKISKS